MSPSLSSSCSPISTETGPASTFSEGISGRVKRRREISDLLPEKRPRTQSKQVSVSTDWIFKPDELLTLFAPARPQATTRDQMKQLLGRCTHVTDQGEPFHYFWIEVGDPENPHYLRLSFIKRPFVSTLFHRHAVEGNIPAGRMYWVISLQESKTVSDQTTFHKELARIRFDEQGKLGEWVCLAKGTSKSGGFTGTQVKNICNQLSGILRLQEVVIHSDAKISFPYPTKGRRPSSQKMKLRVLYPFVGKEDWYARDGFKILHAENLKGCGRHATINQSQAAYDKACQQAKDATVGAIGGMFRANTPLARTFSDLTQSYGVGKNTPLHILVTRVYEAVMRNRADDIVGPANKDLVFLYAQVLSPEKVRKHPQAPKGFLEALNVIWSTYGYHRSFVPPEQHPRPLQFPVY